MNRIVLTGDTHGFCDAEKIIKYQNSNNKLDSSDYLIICGDCGVVWDSDSLPERLDFYSGLGTNILFVDGNHENFDLLNSFPISIWHGGKVHKLADNVIHLMRGQVFVILGKKFLTIGGANSIDKIYRENHISWWKEEEFTQNDIKESFCNLINHENNVDFIISHSPNNEFLDILYRNFTRCGESVPFYLQDKLDYSYTSANLQKIAKKLHSKNGFVDIYI